MESFLIPIQAISDEKFLKLKNSSNGWDIESEYNCVYGYSISEDLFDMKNFLIHELDIEQKYIYWLGGFFNQIYDIDINRINNEILQNIRRNKLNNIKNEKRCNQCRTNSR